MLTIQDGAYTLNTLLVSEIEWDGEECNVTMASGKEYSLDAAETAKLKEMLGL